MSNTYRVTQPGSATREYRELSDALDRAELLAEAHPSIAVTVRCDGCMVAVRTGGAAAGQARGAAA